MRVAFICMVACAVACAPRGSPPGGRQLVADRISSPAGFLRPNGDGLTRLLMTRPGQAAFFQDLYVLSFDPVAAAPPVERLLIPDMASSVSFGCGQQVGSCFETDARGRLLLTTTPAGSPGGLVDLVRLDPITGERFDFGPILYNELSPDGQRLLVHAAPDHQQDILYDEDDRVIPLGVVRQDDFVGAFLYYVDDQHQLMRLAVGGSPERVATGVDSFQALATTGATLLALSRPAPGVPANTTGTEPVQPIPDAISFLDTVTLQETPSPLGNRPFNLSPDGQWLMTADYIANDLTFVNRVTGEQAFIPSFVGVDWRPGHDEVWLSPPAEASDIIAIGRPGASPRQIAGRLFHVPRADAAAPQNVDEDGAFTPDGAYWFSNAMPQTKDSLWQLGAADDPTGPLFAVTPRGSNTQSYWMLADGRLLAPAFTDDYHRANVFVVDPRTGDRRVMGEEGTVIAVGQTRFLMNQHVNDAEGDLTVFQLATGQATVLAPEFTLAVFVQPPATGAADSLAPGALVVFQYQARFASAYDGIWAVAVP